MVMFLFAFVLRYFLISFLSSTLTQGFLISTLFSLHVFVFISVTDFSFRTLMVTNDIISILLNLLKFLLWPRK